MKKLLLTMLAMVCVSVGTWAAQIGSGSGTYVVADGVVTFSGTTAGEITQNWSSLDFSGATRIKFDNTCSINQADLEKFLQGNTYYVDLFDITKGDNAKMSTTDIDPIIQEAVRDMVDNSWQAKGIILPLNTSLGTSKVEKLMLQHGNKYATFSEYAVYYKQNIATIYAHDETIQYTYPSQSAQVAQGHFDTAYTHLTEHSEVNPDIYMVSTNNDRRLDLSSIPSGKTKISIIDDEMVYRKTLANIYVEATGTGKFAEAVEYTNIEYTPCNQLVIEGPINGDDVAAVNEFNKTDDKGQPLEGPHVYNFAATTGATKAMLKDITNSKLEYIVLPNAMATEQIVASDFDSSLTASTSNLKAAIAPSADKKKLSAYVNKAGFLGMARYYATGGTYNQHSVPNYTPSKVDLTDVILSGNLNASDICAQILNSQNPVNPTPYIDSEGHWSASYAPNPTFGLDQEYNISTLDLENAIFEMNNDMNFWKASLQYLTSVKLPTSTSMNTIPANCLYRNALLTELHIPYNYKIIEDGAFWLTGINHITTEDANRALIDNGPLTYTLSNHIERLGITPDPVTNAITCPIFPQNMGVLDIYSMATKTPMCYKNVFPANSCDGWGGFLDNMPYCRDKYYNGENPLQSFAVLHFPSEETYNAANAKDTSYDLMKKYYTDVNKHFTKKEQTGAVDANGDPIVWPTLEEVYRTYNQASLGLTWNDWVETYSDQGIPQVNGGQPKVQLANGVYSRTAEAAGTGVGDYPFDNYAGWHQLVLSLATYYEPSERVVNEKIIREYEEAGWYTFCIPFNMSYKQVVEMLGVPKSTENVINKLNGEEVTADIMPDIRQLSSVTRKAAANGKPNIVMLRMTKNLWENPTAGYTGYLQITHNTNSVTTQLVSAEPYNASSTIDDRLSLIGGRPYIIKAYKRKQVVDGVDQFKIKGQNLGKYVLERYADQFGIESSIVQNTKYESYECFEQLGSGDLPSLRFAKPYEKHRVQAVRDGEDGAYLTYETDENGQTVTKKYYYTMVGQFWQQPLPQYCLYMSKGNWYRYTNTSLGYTWDPYKCVIMATQELVKVEGDKHYGEGFRRGADDEYTNYPQVEEGTTDLIKTEFKLGFLDGRDDDDFEANGTHSKYMFTFDDDIVEIDADGNEYTAIEQIDGETIMPVNAKVYNMSGQYVGTSLQGLSKGLYIVNGKKYIVK